MVGTDVASVSVGCNLVGRVELDACLACMVGTDVASVSVGCNLVGRVELDACLAWLVGVRLVATYRSCVIGRSSVPASDRAVVGTCLTCVQCCLCGAVGRLPRA